MNHKVTVLVSSLLLLFSQTSVFSQSSFQNTTLANTYIAQQSDSDSSANPEAPKIRRSAGPRFIDLQFPENDSGGGEYIRQWVDSNGKIDRQYSSSSLEELNQIIANNPEDVSAYNNRGNLYAELGKYDLALADYNQAISLNPQTPIYINRAILYRELGEYNLAFTNYDQALQVSQKNRNRLEEATTLNNLGMLYTALGRPKQALDNFNKAFYIFEEIGDRINQQYTLNQIALTYYELGTKEKSLDYFQQVLTIAQEQNDTVAEGITLNNIGEVYWSLGQKTTARKYYELALENLQDNNSELITTVKQNIARNLSTEEIAFSCGSVNGIPTTIANTSKGDLAFISWHSRNFTGFFPQKRCEIITTKLEKGYRSGLQYLTTGIQQYGEPVICMTSTIKGNCEEVLLTLKSNSDPAEELQALLDIRTSTTSSQPLYQSSSSPRVYINLEEYLNTAPPIQEFESLTKRETRKVKRSLKPISE